MAKLVRLFVTVLLFAAISGGLLAALEEATKERIAYQQLLNVKGPAIKEILKGCNNDPLKDIITIKKDNQEIQFFVGKFQDKPPAVVFESFGKGFGGKIGVMVGIDIKNDKIIGIGITTHSETPGLGARAKTDAGFKGQFKGMDLIQEFKVKADGGSVDALSGATMTSRGICDALNKAKELYNRLKPDILKNLGRG